VRDDGPSRRSDYTLARISAALALIAVVVVMGIGDVVRPEYHPDAIIVTSILGAAAAMLGVEIIDFVSRQRK
jgi:hypothetical protein